MWNLIRKDIKLQKMTFMIMLPLLLVAMNISKSVLWLGIIFAIAIIMQNFAADEKPATHLLLNSLPYTRKEIVSAKYIGAGIFTFFILLTIELGHLLFHFELIHWSQLLFIASAVLLFISVAFPFSYLFGSQYLLIAFGVLVVVYLIVISLFLPHLNDIMREWTQMVLSLAHDQLYVMIIFSILVLYISSWLLSIYIYRKKVI